MKIRLHVACTLGAAGALVDVPDRTAERLIRRRVAEPAPPVKAPAKKKAATPSKE